MARAPVEAQYRYARSEVGAFVNISDYKRGEVVRCIGCDRQMVGRQGKATQWHFAHKSDAVHSCSVETVLHRLGKAFIKEGFEKALAEKRPFTVKWPCPRCKKTTTQDCSTWFENVEVEGSPAHGIRSDLLLHGKQRCAIEIVVTHDIDEETSRLYAEAKVPVFVVRPTWDSIMNLRGEIVADELRFATNTNCPGCQALDELAKSQDVAPLLEHIRSALERRPRFPKPMRAARRWSMRSDQRGKDLDQSVQEAILAHAQALAERGFTPLSQKMRLCRQLRGVGNLFADLRGTPDVPNSVDPRPVFYLQLHAQIAGDDVRMVIREHLRECLQRLGCVFRDVYVSPESHQAEFLLLRK